jgi:hypothetical protein
MSVTMPSAGGTAEDQRNEQIRQPEFCRTIRLSTRYYGI